MGEKMLIWQLKKNVGSCMFLRVILPISESIILDFVLSFVPLGR